MLDIHFEKENSRAAAYENQVKIGECDIVDMGGYWKIIHTEVDPDQGGRGIARRLVDAVVQAAKQEGVKIDPSGCSYADHVFEKEPNYQAIRK